MTQRPIQPTETRQQGNLTAIGGLGLAGILIIGVILCVPRIWRAGSEVDPARPTAAATSARTTTAVVAATRPTAKPPALFSDEYVTTLMSIPEFAAQASPLTAPQRRELAMALASRGVQRLDDGALGDRAAHLATVLDRLDDSLCFNVAVGIPLTSGQWVRLLEAMDQSDSLGTCTDDWGRAYRAAIVAELQSRPKRRRDPIGSARAIVALRRACTDDEREFFARAGGAAGSLSDFAAGLRLTYRKVPQLSAADRVAVLRLLVSS